MAKLKYDEAVCPECAEVIKAAASTCKHCGHKITQQDISARRAKSQQDANNSAIGCGLLIVLVLLVAMCSGGDDDGGGGPGGASEVDRSAATAANREAGFHCLSGWDGSHPGFVENVKAQLREPSSFEHIETRVTPNKEGKHAIIMEYRARNGFGGMNVGTAIGAFDNATCQATTPILSN